MVHGPQLARAAFVAVAALVISALVTPAARATTTATSFVTMTSESGDHIGGGVNRLFVAGDAGTTVSMNGNAGAITVNVADADDSFSLSFAAAEGAPFAVGLHGGAQRTFSREPGRPGLDISGNHNGCNTVGGRFIVRDVAYDGETPTRLWLTYEQHCDERVAALYGEVQVNMPPAALLVTNSVIDYPETYPGTGSSVVPVTLRNTGTAPETLGAASLEGSDLPNFAITHDTCSGVTLQPGTSCAIDTQFTPSAPGPVIATLVVPRAEGKTNVPLTGSGIDGYISWRMYSQPGEHIGQGQRHNWSPLSGSRIRLSGDSNAVGFHLEAMSGDAFHANFSAPPGGTLAPGTYAPAAGPPTDGAGIAVAGGGNGCMTFSGHFTVHEAVFDPDTGRPQRMSLTFEQHCDGAIPGLFGSIAYRSSEPTQPVYEPEPDVTPPPPVGDFMAYGELDSVTLRWTNPSEPDFTRVVVSAVAGSTPPGPDGEVRYEGTGQAVTLGPIPQGQDVAVSVWAYDVWGNRSDAASLVVIGTDLEAALLPNVVTYTRSTTLTTRLYDSRGTLLRDGTVAVYARPVGSRTFTQVGSITPGDDGVARYSYTPSRTTQFQFRYRGDALRIGSTAGPVTLGVRCRISGVLARTAVPYGGVVTISGSVGPSHAGQVVQLQRYYNGAWRFAGSRTLSARSTYDFTFRAGLRGTFRYRVVKPADADHYGNATGTLTLTVR